LREGDNAQAIDLFNRKHARQVLSRFGQACGQLPDTPTEIAAPQAAFLESAISQLAVADYIVCVQLVLFAEMFRDRPWTLEELETVGGVAGTGEKFLEFTFGPNGRDKRLRVQRVVAAKVLEALLPPAGTDLRGGSKSLPELREAVATSRPWPVIRYLTTRNRLTANTKNCSGASTACTSVQREASRRARCSAVYSGFLRFALMGWSYMP
jgi:hypothetical protein